MLGRLDIVLDCKEINVQMGSLFHGVIMENTDSDYAEKLHGMNLNPFSQFLYFDRSLDSYIWRINTLNTEAQEKILDRLEKIESIYLKHNGLEIPVKNRIRSQSVDMETFIHRIFISEVVKTSTVRFLTPTAFKSKGKYINIPTPQLIFQSSAMKLNQFAQSIKTFDRSVFEILNDKSEIAHYRLQSKLFYVEKVRIRGFEGELKIFVGTNNEMRRLARMLLELSTYTGIGIKTGMGMGGVIVE